MKKDYKTEVDTVLADLFGFEYIKNKNEVQSKYESYYYLKNHIYRLKHVASNILPFVKPNSKILDLGSDGVFPFLMKYICKNIESHAISKKNETIVFKGQGEIYSSDQLGFYDSNDDNSCIKIKKFDIEKDHLPFEDNSIDIITCFEVLEHLKSNPMHLMAEVNRIIKRSGGLFFLTTPNINSFKALKRMLYLESPYFYPPYFREDMEIGHFKEYSYNEIRLLFNKGGFHIINIETFNHVNNAIFNHDKSYQIKELICATKEMDEIDFENNLSDFLTRIKWDKKASGDYFFIVSEWNDNIKEKFYFPLYE